MPPPIHATPTLQKLSEQIKSHSGLPEKKKTEFCSDIRCFARICGKHPTDIIADPAVIRSLSHNANWQLAGLSKESWANVKSGLTGAMKLGGINVDRRRRNYKLAPEWDALLAPLSRRDRDELHRFAGWCSVHDISPEAVDQAVFDCWLAELEAQSIQWSPRARWQVVCRRWNRTVAAVPNSSFPRIVHVKPGAQWALKWSAFPLKLQAELEEYKLAVTTVSPLDLDQRKPIKPVTLKGYVDNLRCYLSRLVLDGVAPSELSSLAACVKPALVKRGLEHCLADRPLDEKTKPLLSAMMVAILSVSHHVGVSDADMKELKRLFMTVRHVPVGMSERNERRLAQFDQPEVRRAYINLAFKVAKRLAHVTEPTIRQALEMQMAVLVAVLLFLPVRIKNAAALDLDKHIMRPIGTMGGRWLVHFEPGEVKNGKAIDGQFNEIVSALLARYVDVFRPVLLKGRSSKLFVSQHGTGKGPRALGPQFSRFIRREIGLIVNPHLMRHFAAFAYLEANPGDFESVRQMLGHKNIATTITFYAKACMVSALTCYDGLISAHLDVGLFHALATFQPKMTSKRTKKAEEVG